MVGAGADAAGASEEEGGADGEARLGASLRAGTLVVRRRVSGQRLRRAVRDRKGSMQMDRWAHVKGAVGERDEVPLWGGVRRASLPPARTSLDFRQSATWYISIYASSCAV